MLFWSYMESITLKNVFPPKIKVIGSNSKGGKLCTPLSINILKDSKPFHMIWRIMQKPLKVNKRGREHTMQSRTLEKDEEQT